MANIADLEPGEPMLRDVDSDLAVYLVQIDGEIRAWDASSPISRCTFVWVAINRRFEDPCSGAKWCIDGTIVDRRHKDATTLRSYETELNSVGEILVYPLKRIAGDPLLPDVWVSDPAALQEATVDCGLP